MVIGRGSWVYISCPAGGADCVITVAADGTATSTGGTPTIMRSEDPDPTDTPGTPLFGLPDGHTLSSRTIAAGATVTIGANASLSCPSGGEACVITVSDSGSARSTGGTPIVIVTIIITRPTPGVGNPGGGSTPVTWAQLPSLVDRMNARVSNQKDSFPSPVPCGPITNCQAEVKTILAASTETTGTSRRFRGTRTFQTITGIRVTGTSWGGWLDNSIFLVEHTPISLLDPNEPEREMDWTNHRRISMGIRNRNPVTGTYRGEAVDRFSNWGTAELNYAGGQVDLTINIPNWEVMRWSNVPVHDNGHLDNELPFDPDAAQGPRRLKGWFYQGDEVGGVFAYRLSRGLPQHSQYLTGAFGAKRTP